MTDSVTVCELLTPWLLRSPCCAVIFMLWVIFNSSHNIWGMGGGAGWKPAVSPRKAFEYSQFQRIPRAPGRE